jgi:rubrerythrin
MEEHDKLIQLIKNHIRIERDDIKRLGKLEKEVGNAAAKLLLLEMELDSKKHIGILTGILEMLKGVPPSKTLSEYRLEGYIDPIVVRKEVEQHIKTETDGLAHVQEEIGQTKDESLKLLLQHIAEDERKHHQILEAIAKDSYRLNP